MLDDGIEYVTVRAGSVIVFTGIPPLLLLGWPLPHEASSTLPTTNATEAERIMKVRP